MNDTTTIKLTENYRNNYTTYNLNSGLFFRHDSPKLRVFLPPHIFLKTILASRTSGTLGFAPTHKADPLAKPKEPLFSQRLDNKSYFALMNLNGDVDEKTS